MTKLSSTKISDYSKYKTNITEEIKQNQSQNIHIHIFFQSGISCMEQTKMNDWFQYGYVQETNRSYLEQYDINEPDK